MELTQQHFDQTIKTLATKDDLKIQTKELKEFAKEQTDELARIISTSVAEPMEDHFRKLDNKIDVKARVEILEKQMSEMRTALHLS